MNDPVTAAGAFTGVWASCGAPQDSGLCGRRRVLSGLVGMPAGWGAGRRQISGEYGRGALSPRSSMLRVVAFSGGARCCLLQTRLVSRRKTRRGHGHLRERQWSAHVRRYRGLCGCEGVRATHRPPAPVSVLAPSAGQAPSRCSLLPALRTVDASVVTPTYARGRRRGQRRGGRWQREGEMSAEGGASERDPSGGQLGSLRAREGGCGARARLETRSRSPSPCPSSSRAEHVEGAKRAGSGLRP